MSEFNYLFDKPQITGKLRTKISDFKVVEILPYSPCGEGEHLYIYLRKTGANTNFVARQLAKYFNVKENLVSYAGLKDRFAVTEQWFGVHLPGKKEYDLSDMAIEGVEVLLSKRHNKKLRIGSLLGNRFELILRDVSNIEALTERWQKIVNKGVPNYFGEQRFGINGGNIPKALDLFAGNKVRDKKIRGIYLSAARSYVFNHIVSERIKNKTFDQLSTGDVCMLAGTQSVFKAPEITAELNQRLIEKDIDITASIWGAGELMTTDNALLLEQSVTDKFPEICAGLSKFGLKQERRKIRLSLTQANLTSNLNGVTLTFMLPSGSYATTVLRELLDYQDMTERVNISNNEQTNNKP